MFRPRVCLILLLICTIHCQSSKSTTRGHRHFSSKLKLIEIDIEESFRSTHTDDESSSLSHDGEVECGRGSWNESYEEEKHEQVHEARIAGGFQAKPGWFPSFMALQVDRGLEAIRCGATLIDKHIALTAGHCAEKAWSIQAIFGNANIARPVKRACIAKGFNVTGQVKKDFAVLILENNREYGEELQPACLPKRAIELEERLVGVGMGRTSTSPFSRSLQGIKLKPIGCTSNVAPEFTCLTKMIGGGAVCKGDSGSGVYSIRDGKQYLAAVVSHGPDACNTSYGAVSKFLDTYTVRDELALLINKCKEGVQTSVG